MKNYFCVISTIFVLVFCPLANALEPCFDETAALKTHFTDCTLKADQGNILAQYNLGVMYEEGKGVSQDYKKAVYWYIKAAEQGDVEAQTSLGWIYFAGFLDGGSRDHKNAVYWYTRAAEQGVSHAQYLLGWIYRDTAEGLAKNYKEAVYWYTRAAEQGDSVAQTNLGLMYYNGEGVPQDNAMAHLFFTIAAANGDKDASELRDLVGGRMTPAKMQEAQSLATEWMESHPASLAKTRNHRWTDSSPEGIRKGSGDSLPIFSE